MHEAISRIWQDDKLSSIGEVGDRAVRIKEIIEETVAEYLDTSFLPANEKEAVKKELFEDAPVVAKALEAHFFMGAHFRGKRVQKEKAPFSPSVG